MYLVLLFISGTENILLYIFFKKFQISSEKTLILISFVFFAWQQKFKGKCTKILKLHKNKDENIHK